jgi:hypothetical protein
MAIAGRTRKILWGRAANRCALCRIVLVEKATSDSAESVIGDECHIVAQSPRGPRHRELPADEVDTYENLMLLCCNHHKLIDDQPETYTESVLRLLKANHEKWVADTLDPSAGESKRYRVHLITSGEEILEIVSGVQGYDFNHDSLRDSDEMELVSTFLQSAQDWGEIWDDIESAGHVEARFHLGELLKELRVRGFIVYGAETIRSMRINGKSETLRIAMLRVLRDSNPAVPAEHRATGDSAQAAE